MVYILGGGNVRKLFLNLLRQLNYLVSMANHTSNRQCTLYIKLSSICQWLRLCGSTAYVKYLEFSVGRLNIVLNSKVFLAA